MFETFEPRTGGLAIEMWRDEDDDAPHKDGELENAVWAKLREFPALEGSRDLELTVRDGVATLWGKVASYRDKLAVAALAARVPGIVRVQTALFVVPTLAERRSDETLSRMVHSALEWHSGVPAGVTGVVANAHVTLMGVVAQQDQRAAAEDAVARLKGICGVTNRIAVSTL